MLRRAKKVWQIGRADGLYAVYRKARRRYASIRRAALYQEWIRKYDTITEEDRLTIRDRIETLPSKPTISILMPVYNVDEKWLRKAIESVIDQIYSHWELCIADDCSTKPHVRKVVEEYAAKDGRIKVVFRPVNGHISAASNSALELATGEFTALLDHDDELPEHALYMVAAEIDLHPEVDMIYSDEDMIDVRATRYEPKFKPDWSPDLFYSMNMAAHLIVYRTSLLRKVGGFRVGIEGSQDYDLALRTIEEIPVKNIRHIPHVLYHWRSIPGSVAFDVGEKSYAHERARRAIEEHFERKGTNVECIRGVSELHRSIHPLPAESPHVSIIVTGGEISKTLGGILSKTKYDRFEIIVVGPGGDVPDDCRVKRIVAKDQRLYERLNEAVKAASGSVLCFLDGSTSVEDPNWLREAVSHAMRKEIGAVGVKILYPGRKVKNAGLILEGEKGIVRAHYQLDADDVENIWLWVAQDVSAVSSECLTIRKDVFEGIGGFDFRSFPAVYADVDLCLRLLETGYRNVWTPWAELIQSNKPAEGNEDELRRLREKWSKHFERDPYFNPNLSIENGDRSLAFPPRGGKFSLL